MLAAGSSPVVPALVTSGGVVISGLIAAFIQVSGKRREHKANELNEAWENRGRLVDSLKERVEQEVQARQTLEKKLERALKENAVLKRRVTALETQNKRRE